MAENVIHDSTTNYMTRAEYEARHASLEARVAKIEAELATVRTDLSNKMDKIVDRIDQLKEDVYKYRNSALTMALGWVISFLVGGGGLFGLLEVLHVLR